MGPGLRRGDKLTRSVAAIGDSRVIPAKAGIQFIVADSPAVRT